MEFVLALSVLINVYFFYRLSRMKKVNPHLSARLALLNKKDADCICQDVYREVLSRDKQLDNILDEVVQRAEKMGFKFIRPGVRVRRSLSMMSRFRMPGRAYACGNMIVFDEKWLPFHNKNQLVILMAHELGHIIDQQTQRMRIGHPLFQKIGGLNNENFADAFAAFLYSKRRAWNVIRDPWYRRYGKRLYRLDKEAFYALDLSVDEISNGEDSIVIEYDEIANTA